MRKWRVMVLALLIGAWSTSAQAATITFDQLVDGGSIAYDGLGGTLTGTAISIDVITGTDVPSPGVLTCVDCELNFFTGVNTGEGPATWTFASGGLFAITGNAFDGATPVASGILLAGTFGASPIAPMVVGAVNTLIMMGFGPDVKDPDILAFFGLSPNLAFVFATAAISGGSATFGPGGSFSSVVTEADVVNFSVVPDGGFTIALLGLGLVGLGTLRRKFLI